MGQHANFLPPQLLDLPERERQIASAIYTRGPTTAKDLERMIRPEVSNGAIRSMLVRLVRKGILRRDWGRRGRGQQFIYMPMITPEEVRHRAIRQLSERYFEGSLLKVLIEVFDVLNSGDMVGASRRFDDNGEITLGA